MNIQLKEIAKVWPDIQPIFSVPHNKKDYNKLVNLLDSLIDEVGNNENHPLASLMETIGSKNRTKKIMVIFHEHLDCNSSSLIFP